MNFPRVVHVTLAFLALTVLSVACTSGNVPTPQAKGCVHNTDCNSGLVCLFQECAPACKGDRDCATGARCLATEGGDGCVSPAQSTCAATCPTGTVCGSDDICRTDCTPISGLPCVTGQACKGTVCVGQDPAHDTPSVSGKKGGNGSGGGGGAGTTSSASSTVAGSGGATTGSTTSATTSTSATTGTGTTCTGTQMLCNGVCIDTANDAKNCGACGTVCALGANVETAACTMGACTVATCKPGHADCNAKNADGCEVDTTNDAGNCGGCNLGCTNGANVASAVCAASACKVLMCTKGYADCNAMAADGCEVDTSNSPKNCGGCGTVCPNQVNVASETCVLGTCNVATCNPGHADCNGSNADGCEVDTTSSALNCGACGTQCLNGANVAAEACVQSACKIGTCSKGYTDCNGLAADGCETTTATDINNCGACGAACANGANVTAEACTGGACNVTTCSGGFADCNGSNADGCEANTATSINNCGGCGVVCAAGANVASEGCMLGVCKALACKPGYADCNGLSSDGCETNMMVDAGNCGACGSPCAAGPNVATEACVAGACKVGTCSTGYSDCDGTNLDGCEVNTAGDTANCGGCGVTCVNKANVATEACMAGACKVAVCNPGFGDCDGANADGCEVNTTNNVNACGACGAPCAAGPNVAAESCSAGVCKASVCKSGYADCNGSDADGCEVNTTNDASNCAGCGTACAAGANVQNALCAQSVCKVANCNAGYADCNGVSADGCEIDTTSNAGNCGGCGSVCPAQANVTAEACQQSQCKVATCATGFADCDGFNSNGCEVNTTNNVNACGGCGAQCLYGANVNSESCTSGACKVGTCNGGYLDCNGTNADGCEVNSTNDAANCSACNAACPKGANVAVEACSNSTCKVGTCSPGYADCDGTNADGCEVNTASNLNNCGGCGVVCATGNNVASEGCVLGVCKALTCNPGFADCNGLSSDGCETNIMNSTTSCGACGSACTAGANVAGEACVSGTCKVGSCNNGYADCDGANANGCEINTNADPAHCGNCGLTCANQTNAASEACTSGQCKVATCKAGYADCDNVNGNGCEINLTGDAYNCGSCFYQCPTGVNAIYETCVASTCKVGGCYGGHGDCNGVNSDGCETDTSVDNNNCGSCGNACTNGPNVASEACSNSSCKIITCKPGFANCNNVVADGCEVDLTADPANCGGCNVYCGNMANVTAESCVASACKVGTCANGYADCDGSNANGCEKATAADVNNCGGCGVTCAKGANVATEACAAGACKVATCNAGYTDCDGLNANGCEVNTAGDASNCGACGTACSSAHDTPSCGAGACTSACASGYANCNSTLQVNGCNVATATDVNNCGACGTVCSTHNEVAGSTSCAANKCSGTCKPNFANCDNTLQKNGCNVSTLSNTNNCGACGKACNYGEACSSGACLCNGGAACAAGAYCTTNGCVNGWPGWPMPNPVSSGAPNPASYDTSIAGVVTDKVTGLMWEQPMTTTSRTWPQSKAYCAGLALAGHSDWRLPSRIELISLFDFTVPQTDYYTPAISAQFPGTSTANHWTSSPDPNYPATGMWIINFGYGGGSGRNSQSYTNVVRCVR